MTEQDRSAFAEMVLGLGETYGEAVSDARMEIYFRALEDLALKDIRAAVNIHVRTQKFFPRPSELRDAIHGDVEDRSELAWVGLLKLVRSVGCYGCPTWPDEAMRRAALELYGGWSALCENLPGEGVGLAVAAKQFKATYRSYAARDAVHQLPAGNVVVGLIGD